MGFDLPVSSMPLLASPIPLRAAWCGFFLRRWETWGDEGAWTNSSEGSLTLPVPWGSQWLCGKGCSHLVCLQAWQLHPPPLPAGAVGFGGLCLAFPRAEQ